MRPTESLDHYDRMPPAGIEPASERSKRPAHPLSYGGMKPLLGVAARNSYLRGRLERVDSNHHHAGNNRAFYL